MAEVADKDYQARVSQELSAFQDCLQVHDLPDIFHYWSHEKIRPRLEAFGFSSPTGMFKKYLEDFCARESGRKLRFVSIGSGNCDLEVDIARHLVAAGHSNFVIDCLDLNPAMLERGRAEAQGSGVAAQIRGVQADFNQWEPDGQYDVVLACQSLHHVVNLEGLFAQIGKALQPQGLFLISDMIGRNGHKRWPEALQIVQEFWRELPPAYRYNQLLKRHEEAYVNWDCSVEGFEGIRAQDILPLLLKTFHFQFFLAYGNVIDPFVDRTFGHNFNAQGAWDKDFIDRVHQRDQQEMLRGRIKPVHMLAVVSKEPGKPLLHEPPFTPEFCVRWPDPVLTPAAKEENAAGSTPEAELFRLRDENAVLLDKIDGLEQKLSLIADSRWLKLGRRFGLGPKLR